MRNSTLDRTMWALCLIPALALGACDPKLKLGELLNGDGDLGDSTDDGGEPPAESSGGPTTEQPPPPDSSSGEPGETGTTESEPPADDTEAPVVECDVWAQDCPAGEKCAPWANDGNAWNSLKCVPIDPTPLPPGSPCQFDGEVMGGVDNCEIGSMCWNFDEDTGFGTCVEQCIGTEEDPKCDDGSVCVISNDAVLTLCLPECDALAQDCPENQVCIDNGVGFICVDDASGDSGEVFADCEYLNACDEGLACVPNTLASECDPVSSHCCLPLCDLSAPGECPGAGQQCLSWYGDEPAPEGNENIGLCRLPE